MNIAIIKGLQVLHVTMIHEALELLGLPDEDGGWRFAYRVEDCDMPQLEAELGVYSGMFTDYPPEIASEVLKLTGAVRLIKDLGLPEGELLKVVEEI